MHSKNYFVFQPELHILRMFAFTYLTLVLDLYTYLPAVGTKPFSLPLDVVGLFLICTPKYWFSQILLFSVFRCFWSDVTMVYGVITSTSSLKAFIDDTIKFLQS